MQNRFSSLALVACLAIPLAGCMGKPPGPGGPHGDYRLDSRKPAALSSTGDPGKIAAVDIGMARAAREDGENTARLAYAESNAVLHLPAGVTDAQAALAGRADPAEPTAWTPRDIWASCDGSLAISTGRQKTADGLVGDYATVWTLGNDGNYRWTYNVAALDNPQPPPPPPGVTPDENTIVVTEVPLIEGRIADCPAPRIAVPAVPDTAAETRYDISWSKDATIRWRWEHRADGTRVFVTDYIRDGQWQQAFVLTDPDGAQVAPLEIAARADPQAVAATEVAFAAMAQESGLWTAFRRYAAPSGIMFTPQPVVADDHLVMADNPPAGTLDWQPHDVWASCDGTLAVTRGAWQRSDGSNGYFTTVWQLQADGSYQWLLDQGDELDQPLAAPDAVRMSIASCDPLAPMATVAADMAGGRTYRFASRDGSLRVATRVDPWCGRITTVGFNHGNEQAGDAPGTPRGFETVLTSEVAPPAPADGAAPERLCEG